MAHGDRLGLAELPHIYQRNLRAEKSIKKNFVFVYGFGALLKEEVCLDGPDL